MKTLNFIIAKVVHNDPMGSGKILFWESDTTQNGWDSEQCKEVAETAVITDGIEMLTALAVQELSKKYSQTKATVEMCVVNYDQYKDIFWTREQIQATKNFAEKYLEERRAEARQRFQFC